MRTDLRLSGYGGQGLVTASIVIAEAALAQKGLMSVLTQAHGPSARGGASSADLILADGPIYHPVCRGLDILLALTSEACDAFCQDVKKGGVIVVDLTRVKTPPQGSYGVHLGASLRSELGAETFISSAAVGVLAAITGLVSYEAARAAIAKVLPPRSLEDNEKALELGVALGQAAKIALTAAPDADL